MNECLLVLDFGGQYKELIARMVRELSVYAEIMPGHVSAEEIKGLNGQNEVNGQNGQNGLNGQNEVNGLNGRKRLKPIGIILTGGPDSVYSPDAPTCDAAIWELGIPILGICYGMQMICQCLGGEVAPAVTGEYGRVAVTPRPSALFCDKDEPFPALMSHRDRVTRLPEGFNVTATTASCPVAACENPTTKIYGTQFHPESAHTKGGREIIRRFLYDICGASGDYRLEDYIDTQVAAIRRRVGDNQVLLALSGGVDSSVCAALLSKAIPNQLICLFVDHGFMRKDEGDEIERVFTKRKLRFIRVNATERFLAKLKHVTDPEAKRKCIGEEFIRVFEEEAAKLGAIPFLAQGTIYPDVVESGAGQGATIKSHHNVGGLPAHMAFKAVLEPLAGLFKDEVRVLGKKLGLPRALVNRQPFPGPGLAIRIMGEVTKEKLDILREADAIFREAVSKYKPRPQQYFAVLTDTRSVGVKGDDRTFDYVVALRAVMTRDFMTCAYADIPHAILRRVSSRITSDLPAVSRVVYDITSKPPATVEWA